MSKTFYLAGKVQGNDALDKTKNFSTELESRGHTNICRWWEMKGVTKPYLDNLDLNAPLAVEMLNAAFNAEVFILFAQDDILGAAIEFGAGLASVEHVPDKRIYIVGSYAVRKSVFYTHPSAENVNSLQDIRTRDWY
jgi:hypothetical protein